MLLPPEWAPCQGRQWQTDGDKRVALQYRNSAGDAHRLQNTRIIVHTVPIQETFSPLCDWLGQLLLPSWFTSTVQGGGDTNETPGSRMDAMTADLTIFNNEDSWGCTMFTMKPQYYWSSTQRGLKDGFCSQPSKGGSQWSSSTLLQTEVDLALEWDWKTTREAIQSLDSAPYTIKLCHRNNIYLHLLQIYIYVDI